MKIKIFGLIFIGVMIMLINCSSVRSQIHSSNITVSDPLPLTRIYSDSTGASHFSNMEILFELKDYAPPAPPISVTDFFGSKGWVIISSPVGWHGDWHPTPYKQYMICLAGSLEVQVTDGENRRFGPGSLLLVEDTSGKGHVSRIVGKERCYMVAMPIIEDH